MTRVSSGVAPIGSLAHVRIIALPSTLDARGVLTAIEAQIDIPFEIQRLFYMYRVQPPFERGGHAHPDTEQLVACVAGSLKIDVSDSRSSRTFALDDPSRGLYIPALIWTRLYDFSSDAVCLAAASTHYDNATVIREWSQYVDRVSGRVG